ncbi:unnamed protein product [Brugia pahangi]|uniref:Uncharacterized protein n=1 Tax=Brugia pahangi TaxID=6280 RepID=A0A0N4TGH8_BRUPA|nr:unnamed protein product [Brugia pahangi]
MFYQSIGNEIINISLFFRKHKDRTDDIPNCPSIENIIDMPIPNEILPSEKTETSNVITDSSISNAKLPNGTIQSQTTSSNSFPLYFK